VKKLLVILTMVFAAVSSEAALKEGDLNLMGGAGLYGSRGIMGFSMDRFFTEHHAITGAVGADITGAGTMVGYKYFTAKMNNSSSAWDKCLFIFNCDVYYHAGGGVQYAGSTEVKFTESTGDERDYHTDPKWFGMATTGFRSVYTNGITVDLEITYRSIFAGGDYQQTAGAVDSSDAQYIERGYRGVGFGLAMGYMF
jgi:hypothetical protein